MKLLENQIFSIENNADFEKTALDVFQVQREKCSVYKEYLKILNHPFPKTIDEIPFLPISFFKSHTIISTDLPIQFDFFSSGTTGMIRSKHSVQKPEMYRRSFTKIYKDFIGDTKDQVILALLPNYIEQGQSSLVYMVNELIKETNSALSGFFLTEYDNLVSNYQQAISEGKKVVVFGVSYALLDLADAKVDLSQAQIIETGGMKGRRKEMTKVELHNYLKKGLGCDFISSEYGMTELFSQSYSNKEGVFTFPKWMDIKIRQTNDPFQYVKEGKTGGVNVIDLANLYSCSFIATQDLGKRMGEDFYLMGRFDNSDLRGCNMMVE